MKAPDVHGEKGQGEASGGMAPRWSGHPSIPSMRFVGHGHQPPPSLFGASFLPGHVARRRKARPPQLAHMQNLWGAFMTDCQHLATQHPYSQTPSAGQVGQWASCFCIGAVLGLFCINPDGGDYGAWEAAANEVLRRYGGAFQQAGCFLSLQRTR